MDIELYYREQGIGKTMILLHGNGENGDYFEHQMNYFAKKYHVISIDTRGHGKSKRGIMPFTIEQFVEDLHDFMDLHHTKKAIILGFSDGGNIALKFAMKYGERVEALIVNGANLEPEGVKRIVQIPIELEYHLAGIFAWKSSKAKKNREILGLMVKAPFIKPEDLRSIAVPTLIIAGSRDMIKEKHTKLIASSISGAELVIIPGTHFIANKNPHEFNLAVDNFLSNM